MSADLPMGTPPLSVLKGGLCAAAGAQRRPHGDHAMMIAASVDYSLRNDNAAAAAAKPPVDPSLRHAASPRPSEAHPSPAAAAGPRPQQARPVPVAAVATAPGRRQRPATFSESSQAARLGWRLGS